MCKAANNQEDHVKNYSLSLLWQGLRDLAHQDDIREGDGEAMMMIWRINMLQFWERKHNKYLIMGHRLLCSEYIQFYLKMKSKYFEEMKN